MRRAVLCAALLLAATTALAGCSHGGTHSGASLSAATPALAPHSTSPPEGTVLPATGDATAALVDQRTHTLAVTLTAPPRLLVYSMADTEAAPRTIALPGRAAHISLAAPGGPLLVPVPSAREFLRVDLRSGKFVAVDVPGQPTDVARFRSKTLVAVPGRDALLVLDGNRVRKTITGEVSPDEVLVSAGHVAVLDRLRSALFDVDVAGGTFGAGLRAGQGAVNAVADSYGRVLVTDARTGALLVFSLGPVFERQLFPVSGTPYGITYDPRTHLAWVTITARNEVVGYDVAGGEPVEKRRIHTVRQPNVVAVDPSSGTVIVASGAGEGIQVVRNE
ncbi:MAG: YncE family protein [Sciscionella sp.]